MQVIKIPYSFKTVSAFHTGADIKNGNVSPVRRQKSFLGAPKAIRTLFPNARLRQKAIALVLLRLYNAIQNKTVDTPSQFRDFVEFAANERSIAEFLGRILRRFDIKMEFLNQKEQAVFVDILELFPDDNDFLYHLRRDLSMVYLYLAQYGNESKAGRAAKKEAAKSDKASSLSLFAASTTNPGQVEQLISMFRLDEIEALEQIQNSPATLQTEFGYAEVPYIAGNSIRGYLRDLLFADFCELTGLDEKGISDVWYHAMFAGGTVRKGDKMDKEQYGLKRKIAELCPPFQLLGACLPDAGITDGELSVGSATLICHENGYANSRSFYEYLDLEYGTRQDQLKNERRVRINLESGAKEVETVQMIYHTQTLAPGTPFEHEFVLNPSSAVVASCFARLVYLLKEMPFLGAKRSIGWGKMDFSELILPDGLTDEAYLQYLETKRDEILAQKW